MPKPLPSYLSLAACLAASTLTFAADDRGGIEFFERKIRPVLVQKCYKCHSADTKKPKGGLLLDTREGIRRGGESGHGVVPGNLEESLVIRALRHEKGLEMPPNEKLSDQIIADFERWVRDGAVDPRDGKSAPVLAKIDFERAKNFWSFQPIQNPQPPKVRGSWAQSDIDRFIQAKLEENGLAPVADAEPRVFIRRLYFDLIGLPPTPEEVEAFVADPSPQATQKIVDKLLASPQFGERWGRHWLDVVRYGESTGMERNYTYPYAWRYRDYVIASFNADKPFNEFIVEQVAGDLLPAKTKEERYEHYVATGLLAIGPKSLNERNNEKFLMDVVDDQIDVTTRAFLGLTASCARCHDHKFDPIPTREYYSLAGIFRSTDTYYGTGGGRGNRQAGRVLALAGDSVQPVSATGSQTQNKSDRKRLVAQLQKAEARLAKLKKSGTQQQVAKLQRQIDELKKQLQGKNKKQAPVAGQSGNNALKFMGVLDSAQPQDTQIRIRGEADDRGDTVPRGFLTIASSGREYPIEGSGRLQYAQWLVDPANPLTARVAVNRIWQHLFGQGIVPSVNNFGANGDRPSHPELLDYLATQFVKNNWSVKKMIRSIVLSRVYRLSCAENPNAKEVDPQNRLLSRMNHRRLEAEAIRDAMLAVSGQLDLEPAKGSIVESIGNGDVGRTIQPSRFEIESNKRSVYLPIVRSAVPEMLRTFDFPEPSIVFGQRDVTTVPTQALYMMNSPFVIEQSKHFAQRLLNKEGLQDDERVDLAYRLAFSRPASAAEKAKSLAFVAEATKSADRNKAWTGFCQALLASAEFRYIE
ncbi:MAG: hypothetical protein KatS3mg105_3448 [Gemmatales bacterium]|nr:MAG: hypothetical protein KatS3mg105_3448 [Gemmatales bacterium]